MSKTIPIFLPGDSVAWVAAGPTRELPPDRQLIRCAAEIPMAQERIAFDVSTKDFTPFSDAVLRETVPDILDALRSGQHLYVGCMGGTGRTGTLLALLAAQHPGMSGMEAILYIRAIYRAGAVETREQEDQVMRLAGKLTAKPTAPAPAKDYAEEVNASSPGLAGFNPWNPAHWWRFLWG